MSKQKEVKYRVHILVEEVVTVKELDDIQAELAAVKSLPTGMAHKIVAYKIERPGAVNGTIDEIVRFPANWSRGFHAPDKNWWKEHGIKTAKGRDAKR